MLCVAGLRAGQKGRLPRGGAGGVPRSAGNPGQKSRPAVNMLHLQAPLLAPRGPPFVLPPPQKSMESLVVRGATQHNLKNVSCELPRNQLVVITGPSGSG